MPSQSKTAIFFDLVRHDVQSLKLLVTGSLVQLCRFLTLKTKNIYMGCVFQLVPANGLGMSKKMRFFEFENNLNIDLVSSC